MEERTFLSGRLWYIARVFVVTAANDVDQGRFEWPYHWWRDDNHPILTETNSVDFKT